MIKAYILTLSNVVRETSDAVTLQFSQPAFGRIWYYAGQFVTLRIEIDGKAHFRSYSISSVPQLDSFIGITVKRVKGGLVSNYINDHFKKGQQIEILSPRGKFFIEPGLKKQRDVYLFAAGSGITPIMSILRTILFQEPQSTLTLVYGNRSGKDIIFKSQLDDLYHQFKNRFTLIYQLSQPDELDDFSYRKGRINGRGISNLLPESINSKAEYFLCGPLGMMVSIESELLEKGISSENIYKEQFTEDKKEEIRLNEILGPTRDVRVEFAGKRYEIKVPPGVSVLDAGLSQGFPLPYSCRRGVCSTCMGRLIKGEVEMNDEDSLLAFEKEQGYVLVCQSHPISPETEIKMGYEIQGK